MHTVTRQIGIDMGHRVTNHGSKCKNVHGHRYTIEATISGALVKSGESEGMVLDFGFLKDEMMREIDAFCDHGLCLWIQDPLLENHLFSGTALRLSNLKVDVQQRGWHSTEWAGGKLYLLDVVPTAENLAKHWFRRLEDRVHARSNGQARLINVRVWETPNCYAEFYE